MLSSCRAAETKSDASPLPARGGQGQAPPLLTSAPPWRAPLLIRKPTNHPERLAVPANSGDRSGRRRGRLFLSPNRKIKTPVAFGVAVPANPDTRSARRRGHRRVWPNRKIKIESPLRSASMSMVVALQSPGSRRSVAPYRLCAPQPPLYSPALPRGGNRPPGPRSAAAPSGDLHPLPSAPLGLPLCLRAAPDDRFAATGATLRPKVLFPFTRSRQTSLRSDCRAAGFYADCFATAKSRGRSARPRKHE